MVESETHTINRVVMKSIDQLSSDRPVCKIHGDDDNTRDSAHYTHCTRCHHPLILPKS